jgi:hypothetical protein
MSIKNNQTALAETINEDDAAKLIGVSKITLQRARKRGDISCYRIGARVLYSPNHIEDFLDRVERKSDSERREDSG